MEVCWITLKDCFSFLAESEKERKKIRTEKEDLATRNETLKKELKHLKDELNENITSSDLLSKRKEEALEETRQRYEKQLARMRRSLGDVDEKKSKEMEDLRRKMERAQSAEESGWRSRLEEAREQAEGERAELLVQIDRLKARTLIIPKIF